MIEAVHQIDAELMGLVNDFAGSDAGRDRSLLFLRDSYLLKGVVVMMVWWGLWFRRGTQQNHDRTRLLATVFVAFAAIFVGRLLAVVLPFRNRPIHDDDLNINVPIGMEAEILSDWSSFPSDHAVYFVALAVGILLVHRLLGALLLVHAMVIVALPRVYSGVHFPGDILVGAAVGVIIAAALLPLSVRTVERTGVLFIEQRRPHLFYPLLFLLSFQMASMFDSARDLLSLLMETMS